MSRPRGPQPPKTTVAQLREIDGRLGRGEQIKVLAHEYGLHYSTLWRRLRILGFRTKSGRPWAEEATRLKAEGVASKEIGYRLGVNRSTVDMYLIRLRRAKEGGK